MKEKFNSFLFRKVNMEQAITACMMTFLGTVVLFVVWVLLLTGGFGNLVNTLKFAQILTVIDRVYIGEADTEEVSDIAFASMINSLDDRWSYYMTRDLYEQYKQANANEYVGIGISFQMQDGRMLIVNVTEDSPAARAGMVADTYIIKVNDVEISGMESREVSAMMRENPDHIEIITEDFDGNQKSFTLKMEMIYRSPVSFEMKDGNIGYIQIENFDEGCAKNGIEAIKQLREQGASALVFDVRDNGGGSVTELCDLLDYLLPKGDLFVSVNEKGEEKVTESDKSFVNLPMAVLVNEKSYSAAEFFAAALREYDAATIVGAQTTGKNRSQTNMILVDGSAVHISHKRYLTPNRVDLTEQGGLTPDIELAYGENDAQLEAAMALFN